MKDTHKIGKIKSKSSQLSPKNPSSFDQAEFSVNKHDFGENLDKPHHCGSNGHDDKKILPMIGLGLGLGLGLKKMDPDIKNKRSKLFVRVKTEKH